MSALLAIILTAAASNLNATDESLTATTTTTAATDVTVNYVEFTTSSGANIGSGEQVTNFTTATTSTILAAPAAGTTTRSPSFIKACNKGTSSQTVTIQYVKTAGSLSLRQAIMSLNAGECGTVGNDGTVSVATVGGVTKTAGQPVTVTGRGYVWWKTATATDAATYGYANWKDAGGPGAYSLGTPGLNGRTTDCSVVGTAGSGGALSLGVPLFTNASSGSLYLRSATVTAQAVGPYQLVDVLWYSTGHVVTTTTVQVADAGVLPARDVNGTSNGEGVQLGVYTTTANTNAAVINNSTANYENSDGTGNRTARLFAQVGYQFPATPVIGTFTRFNWDTGDRGIKVLGNITLGTSLVAGAISLVLYRPIATVGVTVANTPVVYVPEISPRLYNGSCLTWIFVGGTGTTAPAIGDATIQVVER
jgi:hypothetical protein